MSTLDARGGSAVLVVVADRRRSRLTPMLWYLRGDALAVLLLRPVPEHAIGVFRIRWYLVTLGLVGALYLLDRPHLKHVAFLAANVIAGVVASYSSLQGLTVWPVGLVLLYLRRAFSGSVDHVERMRARRNGTLLLPLET